MTEELFKTVERAAAVTRECGPQSIIYQATKRNFDAIYDREIYKRMSVAELSIFTCLLISTLREAFDQADREGKRIILV
jgi:hypothetical protein